MASVGQGQTPPTGHHLFTYWGAEGGDQFGHALLGAGDQDGDGRPDVALGAPYAKSSAGLVGRVDVYSGACASLLFVVEGAPASQLGRALAAPGDLDGDGLVELALGAPGGGGGRAGHVRIIAGGTGRELVSLWGAAAGDSFGAALAAPGDLDGDGRGDLVVGAPLAKGVGNHSGRVSALSAATGQALFEVHGEVVGDQYGWSVAGAGDVDGDGVPDILVGAPTAWQAGRVLLYSGAGGRLIREWSEEPGALFGHSLAGAGDLDGDGVPDVAVGAPFAHESGPYAGRVDVLSGAHGGLLWSRSGSSGGGFLGQALAGVPDLDGDGLPELLVGASGDPTQPGRLRLFSGVQGEDLLAFDRGGVADGLGTAVCVAGDLNGDGHADILAGAPQNMLEGTAPGYVLALSAASTSACARPGLRR